MESIGDIKLSIFPESWTLLCFIKKRQKEHIKILKIKKLQVYTLRKP